MSVRTFRLFRRALAGLFGIACIVAIGGYFYLRSSLPLTEGRLALAGLHAPVEVLRDRHGIAHILAKDWEDANFALGFAHAQDRLWQMEMSRRTASGRLSEIFGDSTLEADRFMRTLGIHRLSREALPQFDENTRAVFAAYTAGVNAFLQNRKAALPPEFVILGHQPEPWQAADSVAWIKMMAWDLSRGWRDELARLRLSTRLSPPEIAEFLAPYPGDPPQLLPDLKALYAGLAPAAQALAEHLPDTPEWALGSNNWVVDGKRSVSGKPLLANDPHLGLTAPAVWYFAHLQAGGRKLIGATLPGVPMVVLGRNDQLAWGFTNTGPDVQDLFIEKLVDTSGQRYLTPTGAADFAVHTETLHVKGKPDVSLVVRWSRHGPVISDLLPDAAKLLPKDQVLAFAWTALLPDDRSPQALVKLGQAQSVEGFRAALRDFHVPQQNIVYADTAGNIGFIAAGRVPLRHRDNPVQGLAPVPGWETRFDWQGFIPFEALPQRRNPQEGLIATANEKIVDADYPYRIATDWAPPYRGDRIRSVLRATPKHDQESFATLQADVVSGYLQDVLPLLLAAAPAGSAEASAITALKRWDFSMREDLPEPLIATAWLREFGRLVYEDELGELFRSAWGERPLFIRNVLRDVNGQSRWCDDRRTPATETCPDLAGKALSLALADLRARFGDDTSSWRWGAAHLAVSEHRPFSRQQFLARLFEISRPVPGDTWTVNVGAISVANAKQPFATRHGPSLRAIYDLADLERSRFIHSSGQSGNPFSPFYRDMNEPWAAVRYLPMVTKPEAFRPGAVGSLWLNPQ